jgi:HSP20 family protein
MVMKQEGGKGKGKHKPEDQQERELERVAQGALRSLGKIIPSVGEVLKGLEKSDAFQERLKAAEAEIERQLEKAPPLKMVEGTRKSVIPPKTTLKVSPTTFGEGAAARAPRREVIADIFDEGEYLRVIAEMPGVDERDLKAEVEGNRLILWAQAASWRYHKEIGLPCLVKDELDLSYKNGVLQISLEKERK